MPWLCNVLVCDITSSIPTTPLWLLTRPTVNFTLHCSDKSNTPPEIFKHRFYELCHEFKKYYRIFTDGSKEGNRVAAAVVHRDNTKCVRLPASKDLQSWIICPFACDRCGPTLKRKDSMSSLQSINGFNLDSDLVQKFLKDYTILAKKAKTLFSVGSQVM